MAVRGHGDEIDLLGACRADDLRRRIAAREAPLRVESRRPQASREAFEVLAIVPHLLRLAELQLVVGPGRPAVGDVQQQQLRVRQARERLDVREDRLVCGRVFDGDEDALIHGLRSGSIHRTGRRSSDTAASTFSAAITSATGQASARIQKRQRESSHLARGRT